MRDKQYLDGMGTIFRKELSYVKYNVMLMNGRNNSNLFINVNIDGHQVHPKPQIAGGYIR